MDINGKEQNKKYREYPDWHRMVPERFREEYFNGYNDWTFYYNIDWEGFLFYGLILHNKDYVVEGGIPDWFNSYIENMEIVPFDCSEENIVIKFYKEHWVENTLVYMLKDSITQKGKIYNVKSIIKPSRDFISGNDAPGRAACPQSVWEPFAVKRIERLRYGNDWNPISK